MMTTTDCSDLQLAELQVLESIYPECITSTDGVLKLEVGIEFTESRLVNIQSPTVLGAHNLPEELLSLTVLPSLLLQITLPPQYPLHSPPILTSLRSRYTWYPAIPELHKTLTQMWHPGEEVLFNWVEYLRSGEFLISITNGAIIRIPHPSPPFLSTLMKTYEKDTKFSEFNRTSYPCSVCLQIRKGSKCIQLTCGHIFCRSCLEAFWKLCIKEGDVSRVGCPDAQCIKAKRDASEEEVARVVTADELKRWNWLQEKLAVEKDPSIINCPVKACQRPVRRPDSIEESESSWDRLRTCDNCSYSFCSFCKRTWHGPLAACPISFSETLVLEYLGYDEDSPARAQMEHRFGKRFMSKLITNYEEEKANEELFKSSTMACPGCSVRVEKSLGCNHMTCAKCNTHFCYICGARLPASQPYAHFSALGTPCFNLLFDGATGRDFDIVPDFLAQFDDA